MQDRPSHTSGRKDQTPRRLWGAVSAAVDPHKIMDGPERGAAPPSHGGPAAPARITMLNNDKALSSAPPGSQPSLSEAEVGSEGRKITRGPERRCCGRPLRSGFD